MIYELHIPSIDIPRDFNENSLHKASKLYVRMWQDNIVTTDRGCREALRVRKGSPSEEEAGKAAEK